MAAKHDLTAAVLAGGTGTRLRAVVADRPKPLAIVAGRPFLEYVLDQIATIEPARIVICTGYGADQVQAAIGPRWRGIEVAYSQEISALGTGGALANAAPLLDTDTVLAMNGDSYCDTPLRPFLESHYAKSSAATLMMAWVPDVARYGAVTLDIDDCITGFREKGDSAEGWINAGVYLLSRDRMASVPGGRAVSLEHEMFPQWIGPGLHGYRCAARFIDIGVPEDFHAAQEFFRNHPLP